MHDARGAAPKNRSTFVKDSCMSLYSRAYMVVRVYFASSGANCVMCLLNAQMCANRKTFSGRAWHFLVGTTRICADGDGDAASRIISLRHAASHVARRERSAKCTRWVIMTLCTRLSATLPASRSRTVPRFQWQSNWDTSSSYRQCTRRWGRLNYSRCWEYANSVISDSFHSSWSFQIKAKLSWIIIKFPIKCVPSPFARFKCGSHKQNITEFCFCT